MGDEMKHRDSRETRTRVRPFRRREGVTSAPPRPPAADPGDIAEPTASRREPMQDNQRPILAICREEEEDIGHLEADAMEQAGEALREIALTLPAASSIRALMLRSATRWSLAGVVPGTLPLRALPSPARQAG